MWIFFCKYVYVFFIIVLDDFEYFDIWSLYVISVDNMCDFFFLIYRLMFCYDIDCYYFLIFWFVVIKICDCIV